ncbi:MAG: (2Fe-2S)-binding protein [Planctomycetes bacterium]|nr:(2Fe-2S)-binding protein [Planctomycetota bacterium]
MNRKEIITCTINGNPVGVPPGTTILDAASTIGVFIPTMCFQAGLEPTAACRICLVKDEAANTFVPACAARAEAGMRVTTENDDIRRVRKFTLELLFSDHVGDCEAPCRLACRAGIDIPLVIRRMVESDLEQAVHALIESAGSADDPCSTCESECEKACRRGRHDAPLSIRHLMRYVWEFGVESGWADSVTPRASSERGKRFRCSMGGLKKGELEEFLKDASPAGRIEPAREPAEGYSNLEARSEASRCLQCDCRKAQTCRLRRHADGYGVRQRAYPPEERSRFRRIRHHGIVYEPEKCIKCGLCVAITEGKREALGLTYIGRGFDVEIGVPFDGTLSAAMATTAAECVGACPTGALAFGQPFETPCSWEAAGQRRL